MKLKQLRIKMINFMNRMCNIRVKAKLFLDQKVYLESIYMKKIDVHLVILRNFLAIPENLKSGKFMDLVEMV